MKDREAAIQLIRAHCREYRKKLKNPNDDYVEGLAAGNIIGVISILEHFDIWSLWKIKKVLTSSLLEKMRKAHEKRMVVHEQIHKN